MKRAVLLFGLAVMASSFTMFAAAPNAQDSPSLKLIFSFDKKYLVDDFYVSPDGRKTATGWFWAAEMPARHTAVIDGRRYSSDVEELVDKGGFIGSLVSGAIASAVRLPRTASVTGLVFSPDSKSVAFRQDKGREQVVVLNGAEGQAYQSVRYLTFSRDSRRLAYAAQVKSGFVMVVDGKEGAVYKEVTPPVFSPDGGRLAYAARKNAQEWIVVADGQESQPFKDVGHSSEFYFAQGRIAGAELKFIPGTQRPYYSPPSIKLAYSDPHLVFSRDGKRLAWVAHGKSKPLAVVDGAAGPEYEEIGWSGRAAECRLAELCILDLPTTSSVYTGTPVFSEDGQHVAYLALKNKVLKAVVDGVEMDPGCVVFHPDGKGYAIVDDYLKKTPDGFALIRDGAEQSRYADTGVTARSANFEHFAFAAKKGKIWKIVLNGAESEVDYEKVESLEFVAGSLIAKARVNKTWVVVRDGVSGKGYRDIEDLIVSPDGLKVAFRAKKDKDWIWVTPDHGEMSYSKVQGSLFSPEGGRLAFLAGKEKKWLAVVDGAEGPLYDEVRDLAFGPDGKHWAYAARTGDKWAAVIDGSESSEKFDALISLQFSPGDKRTFVFEGPSRLFYYGRRMVDAQGVKDFYLVEGELR